jgi:curved DNA-binding protein CbpA
MSFGQPSLYAILGVSRDADPAVIEAAYRALMTKYHPDKATGDHRKAAEVNAAYARLRDPKTRSEYDRELEREIAWNPGLRFATATPPRSSGRGRRTAAGVAVAAVLGIAVGLLIFPPTAYEDATSAITRAPKADRTAKAARIVQQQARRRPPDAFAFSYDAEAAKRAIDETVRLNIDAPHSPQALRDEAAGPPLVRSAELGEDALLASSPVPDAAGPLNPRPLGPQLDPSLARASRAARARTAQQAVTAAAENWARCAASQLRRNVRYGGRAGAVDRALDACTDSEQATRQLVRSALKARNRQATSYDVELNMEAGRNAIRSGLEGALR